MAFGKSRTAQLPVMNYRNQAIPNPNAYEVNTAMQRCLAKAISLHGIGLYIYAGEDMPTTDEKMHHDSKKILTSEIQDWIDKDDFESLHEHCEKLKSDEKLHIWQSFNSITKLGLKKYRQSLMQTSINPAAR
jgi:hypothetical protein